MKRILIIAECINKNKTSQGIGTTSFLNALAQGPFRVDCVFYEHVQHELEDTSHIDSRVDLIKINNGFLDQLIQKLSAIRRLFQQWFGINILRNRRASQFYKKLKPIIAKGKYDLVFVRTIAGSIASHKAVLKVSKELDFKWVVNFNDPAPATLMPYPYFNGKVKFVKQMSNDENLVKEIVRKCDGITSPSVLLTQRFLDFAGVKQNHKHIYQFPHIFIKPEHVDVPSFLNHEKFNLVHPGSLLAPRNPAFLLSSFKRFIEEFPEKASKVVLTFFGKIHPIHKPTFDAFEYPEFIDIRDERIPHASALGVLKESSVLIILEAIADESPFMPGKLAEFIGLNKTIWALSPAKSETRRLLGSEYPYQCEADKEDEIFKQLVALYEACDKDVEMKLNLPELAKYTSSNHVIDEMNKILNDLK